MLSDIIKTTGSLQIILRDQFGNIKVEKSVSNLVVDSGKNVMASRLAGITQSVMSNMAVGTNSTPPEASNVTLGSEIPSSRTLLTKQGGSVSNNEITYTATFGAGVGTGAITEAGIFNDTVVGSMLCRTTFAVVNKDTQDTLSITWKVTIN